MKRWFFITTLLVIISTLPSCAQTERPAQGKLTWYTSLAEAQKVSNSAKKPIFAFFTGSDWCGWCQKLHHDVLDKQSFIDWAKKMLFFLNWTIQDENNYHLNCKNKMASCSRSSKYKATRPFGFLISPTTQRQKRKTSVRLAH